MRIKRTPLQLSFYVVGILSCFSSNLFAQVTAPVTVTGVGPEGGMVESIVVDPSESNVVYALADTGMFKSTDRGTTWSYSGLMGTYASTIFIAPQSPATVYAGAPGNIFKSIDAGATWSLVLGTPPNLILLGIDSQGTLFGRIRPAGGFFKSSDEGTTWQRADAGLPSATVTIGPLAIDPRNANTLYTAGLINFNLRFVGVFKTMNGGASWSQIGSGLSDIVPNGLTIDPVNTNTLYITTSTGFLKSTDGGRSWNLLNNGLSQCFCARSPIVIDPQRPDTLYAIRFDGAIFKSTNGGRNWAIATNSFGAYSLTVDPRDSNTLYATPAALSGAFKSTDGGVGWSAINTNLRAIPFVSAVIDPQNPETLYAGTLRRGFLKTIDKGKTWAAIGSGMKGQDSLPVLEPLAIDPQTPSILYAGIGGYDCDPGGVFKSIDAGLNWTDTGLVTCINALIIDPQIPSTIYALDAYFDVFKSIDGGGSWNPITALPKRVTALAIDSRNPQTLYAVAGKVLFNSIDGGMSWNSTGLSGAISEVTVDAQHPGTVYAVITPLSGGGIWKSVDGGTGWQDLSSALPALPNTIVIDPKNSTIYAATDYGVMTSADGAKSWTLLTAAIGKGIQFLTPSPDSTLYAGGAGGLFAISSALQPTVTAVTFDIRTVRTGGSYTATIAGSNLDNNTYFDVQARAPGSAEDIVVLNWQVGTSESHSVSAGVLPGTWTIDGVRAHQDPENHAGSFAQVSAAITVSRNVDAGFSPNTSGKSTKNFRGRSEDK